VHPATTTPPDTTVAATVEAVPQHVGTLQWVLFR
jgi:hypothetical protein